uniref:Putative ovule protein n=1 Tax=Solanum chacoense TaxID=4108 RepID=A0A0V0H4G9_SOLCH
MSCCLPNLLKPDLWCQFRCFAFSLSNAYMLYIIFIRMIIVEVGPKPVIFLVQKTSLIKCHIQLLEIWFIFFFFPLGAIDGPNFQHE